MDLKDIALTLGQLLAMGAWLKWLLQRTMDKLDKAAIDIEVIKNLTTTVRADHDNLIILNERVHEAERDLDAAHEKLRSIE